MRSFFLFCIVVGVFGIGIELDGIGDELKELNQTLKANQNCKHPHGLGNSGSKPE